MEKIIEKSLQNCVGKSYEIFIKLANNLSIIDKHLCKSTKSDTIYLAFNGGKDSIAAYIAIKYLLFIKENSLDLTKYESFLKFISMNGKLNQHKKHIKILYFVDPDIYDEEQDYFIKLTKDENLKTIILTSSYKDGLFYATQTENMKNVFMGIRKDDITSNNSQSNENEIIHPSDGDYPNFMRLYPIFDFNYYEIWGLILLLEFPYPILYDKGYSSLGRKSKTFPNEKLNFNEKIYLPAFCLNEINTERIYR